MTPEAQRTDAQQDLLTTLTSVRTELSQVRQAALDLRNPEFVQELGLSMLEILAKQLQAVISMARNTPPSARATPPPAPPPPAPPQTARDLPSTPDYFSGTTLASLPVPGLVVNADGVIVAANIPAEQLFGKALLNTQVDDLAPERHRRQHAYWRQGFAAHPLSAGLHEDVGHHRPEFDPGVRIMGHGRTVPGLRADGVEMDLDVALGPYPRQPGFTLALMTPKSIRG
jgi:PAS domain-containing protein